jgi:Ni/Fe-hydrogenase 1 B-type cytochrome subunit
VNKQTPDRTSILNFKRYQPLGLRVWHWLNALAVTGLLLTVLLHKTFLNPKDNAALIQEKLADSGTTVTIEIARQAARAMRERMFEWHYYFGFLLTGAFLIRVIVAIVQRDFPWRHTLIGIRHFRKSDSADKRSAFHFTAVKTGYLTFYIAALVMILTGLPMYFSDTLGITKDKHHTLQKIHEFFLWYFVGFLVIHIVGVVVAELREHRGIISDMIHGGDKDS